MIKKIPFLAAAAVGYVLGARAGRGRFDQIKTQADKVWNDPRVQQAASDAQDLAAEKAPVVKEKATAAAKEAAAGVTSAASAASGKVSAAADKISRSKDDSTDLEGIDLVAAASTVPEDPQDLKS